MAALFKAECESCHFEFSKPHLGDFAYGSFLFTSELGSDYALFEALGSSAFDFLDAVLIEFIGGKVKNENDISLLHAACAHFADPIAGQRLFDHSVCPVCHSPKIKVFDSVSKGSMELPVATFSKFMGRLESDRRAMALDFYALKSPNKPFQRTRSKQRASER